LSFDVTVYGTSDNRQSPYLYCGLNLLKEKGFIHTLTVKSEKYYINDRVVLNDKSWKRSHRPYPYAIKTEILNNKTGSFKRIGFDLQDWDHFFSFHCLEECDIIYKRAYRPRGFDNISEKFNTSIRPFGFTYPVNFHNDSFSKVQKWTKFRNRVFYALRYPNEIFKKIQSSLSNSVTIQNANLSHEAEIKLPPEYIFFQVQYYDKNWPEADILNQYRAGLIRLLKDEFKDQFLGGMFFENDIPDRYRDCVTNVPNQRNVYLHFVRNAAIVISTNGFGGSLPWKLAEYFQLGKCVVSENLAHIAMEPIVPGMHLQVFNDYDNCIEVIRELLDHKDNINAFGRNSGKYFQDYIQPGAALESLINDAFS